MDWLILVIVVAGLLLFKFVLNLVRFLRIKRYLTRYKKWHASRDEGFLESKAQVVKLLRDAGVGDQRVTISQPVGYGNLQVRDASVFDNFPHLTQDMSSAAQRLMREAIGTYRARMWQTFNPLYWIESIFYLPREVLGYLGVSAESAFVKALQVIWWVIGLAITAALALFRPELRAFLEGLF